MSCFQRQVVLKVYGGIRRCWAGTGGRYLSRGGGVNSGPGRTPGTGRWTPFCYLQLQSTGFLEVPPIFNNPKRLMNYMDPVDAPGDTGMQVSWPSYACFRVYRGREGCISVVWKAEYAGEANLAGQIPVALW